MTDVFSLINHYSLLTDVLPAGDKVWKKSTRRCLFYGICVKIFITNRYILTGYPMINNTIDRQYTERANFSVNYYSSRSVLPLKPTILILNVLRSRASALMQDDLIIRETWGLWTVWSQREQLLLLTFRTFFIGILSSFSSFSSESSTSMTTKKTSHIRYL